MNRVTNSPLLLLLQTPSYGEPHESSESRHAGISVSVSSKNADERARGCFRFFSADDHLSNIHRHRYCHRCQHRRRRYAVDPFTLQYFHSVYSRAGHPLFHPKPSLFLRDFHDKNHDLYATTEWWIHKNDNMRMSR